MSTQKKGLQLNINSNTSLPHHTVSELCQRVLNKIRNLVLFGHLQFHSPRDLFKLTGGLTWLLELPNVAFTADCPKGLSAPSVY